jgi:hypothetical protein
MSDKNISVIWPKSKAQKWDRVTLHEITGDYVCPVCGNNAAHLNSIRMSEDDRRVYLYVDILCEGANHESTLEIACGKGHIVLSSVVKS